MKNNTEKISNMCSSTLYNIISFGILLMLPLSSYAQELTQSVFYEYEDMESFLETKDENSTLSKEDFIKIRDGIYENYQLISELDPDKNRPFFNTINSAQQWIDLETNQSITNEEFNQLRNIIWSNKSYIKNLNGDVSYFNAFTTLTDFIETKNPNSPISLSDINHLRDGVWHNHEAIIKLFGNDTPDYFDDQEEQSQTFLKSLPLSIERAHANLFILSGTDDEPLLHQSPDTSSIPSEDTPSNINTESGLLGQVLSMLNADSEDSSLIHLATEIIESSFTQYIEIFSTLTEGRRNDIVEDVLEEIPSNTDNDLSEDLHGSASGESEYLSQAEIDDLDSEYPSVYQWPRYYKDFQEIPEVQKKMVNYGFKDMFNPHEARNINILDPSENIDEMLSKTIPTPWGENLLKISYIWDGNFPAGNRRLFIPPGAFEGKVEGKFYRATDGHVRAGYILRLDGPPKGCGFEQLDLDTAREKQLASGGQQFNSSFPFIPHQKIDKAWINHRQTHLAINIEPINGSYLTSLLFNGQETEIWDDGHWLFMHTVGEYSVSTPWSFYFSFYVDKDVYTQWYDSMEAMNGWDKNGDPKILDLSQKKIQCY